MIANRGHSRSMNEIGVGTAGSQLARLLALAAERAPVRTAVVHPRDAVSLGGALEAARMNLIEPVLVGPSAKIAAADAVTTGAARARYAIAGPERRDRGERWQRGSAHDARSKAAR